MLTEARDDREQIAERIVRLPEVLSMTGLSRVTVWRLEREGVFPRHVRITGRRAIGWILSDIRGFLRSRREGAR